MAQDGRTSAPSVVCVLRTGGEYALSHVVALYEQVSFWWPVALPLRFVCLTDHPNMLFGGKRPGGIEFRPLVHDWRGWWSKMEVMLGVNDDLGDVLYMDLDTMIVGPLAQFTTPRPITLLQDFYRPALAQSGLMWLPQHVRAALAAVWLDTPAEHMRQFRGDGEFLHATYGDVADRWQHKLPCAVVSYKVHIVPTGRVPKDVKIICFHGFPRPWQTPLWKFSR